MRVRNISIAHRRDSVIESQGHRSRLMSRVIGLLLWYVSVDEDGNAVGLTSILDRGRFVFKYS